MGNVEKCDKASIFIYQKRYTPLNGIKRSFCALKSALKGYLKIFHFSEKSVWFSQLIFFTSVTKVRYVENSGLFICSCMPGFFYSPRSYMINGLKINCGLLPTRGLAYKIISLCAQ